MGRQVGVIAILVIFSFSLGALAELSPNKLKGDGESHGDSAAPKPVGALVGLSGSLPQSRVQLEFPVEKLVLKNGITFLLHRQRSVPLVSFHTWFRVGAKDELPGESGLAHMFEHMMFKGTKRYPNKEFDRILQANGIVNNAFTTQDYTGYYEILPSSKLELIMDMESDRMASLVLQDSEFQKEREVVLEERRMRYDNDPGGLAWENLNRLVFQGSKYALPVIGTPQDIRDFSVEKLQSFYKKWYVPSNAVVVIVGDFDGEVVESLIRKFYETIPSPPRPVRNIEDTVALHPKGGPKAQVAFPVQSPELMWGVRTVKSGVSQAYALDLLSAILGQGKSSVLYQQLVYQKQIALGASSGHYTLKDDGFFYLQATAKPGVSAKAIKKAMENLLETWLKTPLREEDLVKAKNMVVSDYVESLKTNDGKAKAMALNEVTLGDYREFFKDMGRYHAVTVEDLDRVRSSYLNLKKMVVVVVDKEGKRSL